MHIFFFNIQTDEALLWICFVIYETLFLLVFRINYLTYIYVVIKQMLMTLLHGTNYFFFLVFLFSLGWNICSN